MWNPARRNHHKIQGVNWVVRIINLLLFGASAFVYFFFETDLDKVYEKYSLDVFPPDYFFYIWIAIFAIIAIVYVYNMIRNTWNLCAHVYLMILSILLTGWVLVLTIGDNLTEIKIYASVIILLAIIVIGLIFWYQLARTT